MDDPHCYTMKWRSHTSAKEMWWAVRWICRCLLWHFTWTVSVSGDTSEISTSMACSSQWSAARLELGITGSLSSFLFDLLIYHWMQLPLFIRRGTRPTTLPTTYGIFPSVRMPTTYANTFPGSMLPVRWSDEEHLSRTTRGHKWPSLRATTRRNLSGMHSQKMALSKKTSRLKSMISIEQVMLPSYVESIRDRLAENNHEIWAANKIEEGWIFGERRDDLHKVHPCLIQFDRLPPAEKRYDTQLALQTLK